MKASQLGRAGALAVACVACTRPQAETQAPEPPATLGTALRPQFSREARLEEALAHAPQLSRAAAELLVDSSERHGGLWRDPVDASLVEANRGFAQMAPADLSELGALFGDAYATLSAPDRAAVEGYVERLRRGDATDADRRSRELLAQAVKALPEARRARLQSLIESAIRAGLETEVRTARAALVTPVPLSGPAPQTAWVGRQTADAYHRPAEAEPTPDLGREEARLRALGAQYKSELDSLESRVRSAERQVESAQHAVDSARETPLNKRAMGDPGVTQAEQQLAQARDELQRERNALDDLQTKIRRERIPLSYVQ